MNDLPMLVCTAVRSPYAGNRSSSSLHHLIWQLFHFVFSFQKKTLPEKCPLSGRAFISLLAHSLMEKIADFVDEAGFLFFDDRLLLFFRRFDRRDRDDELHAVN